MRFARVSGLVLSASAMLTGCSFTDLAELGANADAGADSGASETCATGTADCNLNRADGCEVVLATSLTHCGGCGSQCVVPNGTPACEAGKCKLAICNDGFADCDSDPLTGCETKISADPSNCGKCGFSCPVTTRSAVCNDGVCGLSSCAAGTGDCDGDEANGCEANLSSNLQHCGFCSNACTLANGQAQCSSGNCAVASCSSGFADCDTVAGNGCEAMLDGDSKHCGSCNHDCLGGACSAGKCQAVVIASGLGDPVGLALDADNVYVAAESAGKVYQFAKSGGAVTQLATGQPSPYGVLVDGGYVFFSNRSDNGNVVRVPIGGGSLLVLATNQARPANLGVYAGSLYFTNSWGAALMKTSTSGGAAPAIVASNVNGILGLVVDATGAYYSTDSTSGVIGSVALAGGVVTVLASGLPHPKTLTHHGSTLYWPHYDNGTIWKMAKTGGQPIEIASGASFPQGIAADATHVYFADYTNPGRVMRVPVAGGMPEVLATAQPRPRRLVVDETAVYWTNDQGGTVVRLAK